ncbi:hypothetical protein BDZ45DRAFT_501980 [Acephala macrosclerotiorum]|nr:hypothetical protein BDZ45DRAFT_501980 [Acephala macrosclerotiorum]
MTKLKRQDDGPPTSATETALPSSSFPSATSLADTSAEIILSDSISMSTSSPDATSSITITSTGDVSQSTSISMLTTFVTISQAVIITAVTPSRTTATATATIYAPGPPNSTSNFPSPPLGDSLPPPAGVETGRILEWVASIAGGVGFLSSVGVLVWCLCWGPCGRRRRRKGDRDEKDDKRPKSTPKMSISAPLIPIIPSKPAAPYPLPLATVPSKQPIVSSPSLSKLVPGSSWSFNRPPPPTPPQVIMSNPTDQHHRQPPPVPRIAPKPPPQQIQTQWATVLKPQNVNPKTNPSAIYSPATPPYTPSHYSQTFYGRETQYRQQQDRQNPESISGSGWGSSGVWTDVEFLTGENNRHDRRAAGARASSAVLPI